MLCVCVFRAAAREKVCVTYANLFSALYDFERVKIWYQEILYCALILA